MWASKLRVEETASELEGACPGGELVSPSPSCLSYCTAVEFSVALSHGAPTPAAQPLTGASPEGGTVLALSLRPHRPHPRPLQPRRRGCSCPPFAGGRLREAEEPAWLSLVIPALPGGGPHSPRGRPAPRVPRCWPWAEEIGPSAEEIGPSAKLLSAAAGHSQDSWGRGSSQARGRASATLLHSFPVAALPGLG